MDWFEIIGSERARSSVSIPDIDPIIFKHNNIQFDTYTAKWKQFYKLLIRTKLQIYQICRKG